MVLVPIRHQIRDSGTGITIGLSPLNVGTNWASSNAVVQAGVGQEIASSPVDIPEGRGRLYIYSNEMDAREVTIYTGSDAYNVRLSPGNQVAIIDVVVSRGELSGYSRRAVASRLKDITVSKIYDLPDDVRARVLAATDFIAEHKYTSLIVASATIAVTVVMGVYTTRRNV